MSNNEIFINRLIGGTKSSKFQALQVQLLVTAISTQFFSEKNNDFTGSTLSKEVSLFGSHLPWCLLGHYAILSKNTCLTRL